MFTILKAYGLLEELVRAIIIMYEDTTDKVVTPYGEMETFKILAGIL